MFHKHETDSLDSENIPWDLTFVAANFIDRIPYIRAGPLTLHEFIIYLYITDEP